MKIKDFNERAKKEKSKNDLIDIFAIEELPNGEKINHYVYDYDLKKYPLLNDIEIIKTNIETARATDGINGAEYKIKIYSAEINLNDYRIAKGLKPLN